MSLETPSVPDHELFGVIGRGAFGEVRLARNVMGIWRAVKVIRRSDFSSAESYEREFQAIQRYEPVARSTEGLVQVLHVGRNEGQGYFYYVMELADCAAAAPGSEFQISNSDSGQSQTENFKPETYCPRTLRLELARRGWLDIQETLAVAIALARGLARLHAEGLVHRDIKPANIIFVHGRARLADMGLVDHEGLLSLAGTEGYVPPEGSGTQAADLYSLGLVLYEMATGYDRKQFPQLPQEWLRLGNPTQWELHEVILRACEGMPERRYRSAAELEADLAVISSGESVRERRALTRRSRSLKVTGAIAAAGFVIASSWALLSRQRATMENSARIQAERLRVQTELALVESHLAQATANRQTGRTGQRFETLASISEALSRLQRLASNPMGSLPPAQTEQIIGRARTEAVAALTRVDLREIGRSAVSFDRQWGIAADADLRCLAIATPSNTVRVSPLPGGTRRTELPSGPSKVEHVGPFSPDGQYLMVRYDNRENWIWSLATREVVFRHAKQGAHLRGVFWREGVLVPRPGGGFVWRSLQDSTMTRTYPTTEQLMWLTPALDGEHMVGFTRWFKQACLLGGEPLAELQRRAVSNSINMGEFAISPDGRTLAATTEIGEIPLLDLAQPEAATGRLKGHSAEIVAAAFHPDNRHLATSSWDGTTRFWDLATREVVLVHDQWTSALRFSADGTRCAMVVGDSPKAEIMICEVATPRFIRHWRSDMPNGDQPPKKIPVRAAFSPNGRLLAIGTAYGVRLLTVPDLKRCASLGTNEIYALCFSSDGLRLYAGGNKGQEIWNLTAQPDTAPLAESFVAGAKLEPKYSPILTHDIRQFTLGTNDQLLAVLRGFRAFCRVKELDEWRPVASPGEHEWMRTSPHGVWIAIVGSQKLRLLRLSDDEALWETETRGVCRFAFSPDDKCFVALDAGGLRAFDAASGRVLWHRPRSDPYLRVADVAFSDDGQWIAAALQRRDVSLIEAATGQVAVRLTNPTETMVSATAFSKDARYLAVTLADQSVQLWDLKALREELTTLKLDWSAN